MKKFSLQDFYEFRMWFNRNFSLFFDGKFVGLCTAALYINIELLMYRLYKFMNGYYRKPLGDIICMRISGHSLKLYAR